MANVIWTDAALALADDCLIYSKEKFGEKAKNRLKVAFANITKRLMLMPRIGPLDDVFKDEDGEYRFLHANSSIKVCYRVIDEEHVRVFAVLHVKMSPRKQKAYL